MSDRRLAVPMGVPPGLNEGLLSPLAKVAAVTSAALVGFLWLFGQVLEVMEKND
jgi:hypothetical protein